MNKKLFISFAWTGLDQDAVRSFVMRVVEVLRGQGYIVYVNFEDDGILEGSSPGEYVVGAIDKLKDHDVLVVLKSSGHRSEGQLMEIGAAKALGKEVVLCVKADAVDKTYLDDSALSTRVIVWDDEDDLLNKLPEVFA